MITNNSDEIMFYIARAFTSAVYEDYDSVFFYHYQFQILTATLPPRYGFCETCGQDNMSCDCETIPASANEPAEKVAREHCTLDNAPFHHRDQGRLLSDETYYNLIKDVMS